MHILWTNKSTLSCYLALELITCEDVFTVVGVEMKVVIILSLKMETTRFREDYEGIKGSQTFFKKYSQQLK